MVHSFPTRRSSDLIRQTYFPRLFAPLAALAPAGVRSEEHTSELQSHHPISYAVFCLKKKKEKTLSKRCCWLPFLRCWPGSPYCLQSLLTGRLIFFFNDTATTEIYTGWYTLSLHDALPISPAAALPRAWRRVTPSC